ncbi:glycerophosphodiester phosphodiesterase [Desulfosediminicola flagellatus]|uniref:glycerophosphodiester phosphodiesterase n=1 Tax=Desulfosediminicola flagellatus TaxID=2569541 RepID=UPI0010ABC9C4|nr:glycerophosphodiester phosphodiesterase [Desulfosediminicola flagellatus]
MILIGHRGCFYPGFNQNTIRAFDKVASEEVPAIEFDVQLCGDGELVVVHNLNLEEVSNGHGKVFTTDSHALKRLYAGDPKRGKDRIPFLADVLDFFASLPPERRPAIHLELKGDGTGKPAGELLAQYVASGRLQYSDVLASSFNWQELRNIRKVCPTLKIALIDGAIRRAVLIEKAGVEAEQYFEHIFAYGFEQYMIPRFITLEENLKLLEKKCTDPRVVAIITKEIEACLDGRYYTDELLDMACELNAVSVNLWYRTITPEFIDKAHKRGLAVLVFTVNIPEELQALARMGVDGIFTDYYSESARALAQ